MQRVVTFGTFDPIHDGHRNLFEQAKELGDVLMVVVARDSAIRNIKEREPNESEKLRLKKVLTESNVNEALLGDEWPAEDPFRLLGELEFDVLVLGYDQNVLEDMVQDQLRKHGKNDVRVVRLKPYKPDKFKSSLISSDIS